MSTTYLTEKLAEVRAALHRLHQEEALLIKAVLAEPDLKEQLRLNPHTCDGADLELGANLSSAKPQKRFAEGTNAHFPPRPRPGWPMTRANPTPNVAHCNVDSPKLILVHNAI